jgi:biotin carboxylase
MSTGSEYPAAFRTAGVEPVAVLTTAQMSEACSAGWHPEEFEHVHVADRLDFARLVKEIDAYRPLCVIAGSETGVELADALAEAVLPGSGNVTALSSARRDKWAMAGALRRAGIPHLQQLGSDDAEEVAGWLAERGLNGAPLVLKPTRSAGTDDVHLVPSGGDWRAVFEQILGRVNKLGIRNHTVLVSELAEGVELLVDTYSVDGRHGLVDVCRYDKARRGGRIGIYERVDFLTPDDPHVTAVWGYTQQVLDAVGIRNGCGHAEVMLTDDGPRLIEVAARPAGGGHQMISKLATGDNHIERTVRHRAFGEFRPSYQLVSYLSGVFISSPAPGIWRNAEVFAGVDALSTFHAKHFPAGTGDHVEATDDIFTFLAWVILTGHDKAAVDADYARVKEMERQIRVDPVMPRPAAHAAGR